MTTPIFNRITPDQVYTKARNAQTYIMTRLIVVKDTRQLQFDCYDFENIMNGLSGTLQNLNESMLNQIKTDNLQIVSRGTIAGMTISLHYSVLPPKSTSVDVTYNVVAKHLYPLSQSVTITTSSDSVNNNINYISSNSVQNVANSNTSDIVVDDDVDSIFDAIDSIAEKKDDEPLCDIQHSEHRKLLSQVMINAALNAAANVDGLEAGLVEFSTNPLADIISDTKDLILYYTSNTFLLLDSTLSYISANPLFAVEYGLLKEIIGGGDGFSGCVIVLKDFEDHVRRLCGLVLDDKSESAVNEESIVRYVEAIDANTFVDITSFDSTHIRSAKYMIQASSGDEHQFTDLYVLHDGVAPFTREIASNYTSDPFVSFTSVLTANSLTVRANSTLPRTEFVIRGSYLKIAHRDTSLPKISQTKIIQNHSILSAYLQDDIDYVAAQSGSLERGYVIAELAREFRDMVAYLSSSSFINQQTDAQSIILTQMIATFEEARQSILNSMLTDLNAYELATRRAEALDIAYNLQSAYADPTTRFVLNTTLNKQIRQDLNSEKENSPND